MGFADYIQYKIKVDAPDAFDQDPDRKGQDPKIALEEMQEIIMSHLSDLPFESFEIQEEFLLAYIQAEHDLPELMISIPQIKGVISTEKKVIKGENWNKIWEEGFEPITIGDQVIVRATFHPVDNKYKHQIIIEPKMSFGTGHHATTRLMMESMLHLDFKNKSVLDMGCGTGILAILAHQSGAMKVTAVDNDPICIESTLENCDINHCPEIEVFQNEKISANFKTDIILANIQRNVLMEQMSCYKHWLNTKGTLLVSGIYEEAMPDLIAAAELNGLTYIEHRMLNSWCMIHFNLDEVKA
jgi:ribosomal protein L11 methyltransferase